MLHYGLFTHMYISDNILNYLVQKFPKYLSYYFIPDLTKYYQFKYQITT